MAKSKNRPEQKQKLKKRKEKIMSEQNKAAQAAQMPAVRNVPVWDPNALIEITGIEFEAIQNGLTQIQLAQQATQSVMSRNILNGTITMEFEKLNPQTLRYEAMTAEEQAPHVEQFNKQVAAFKEATAKAQQAQSAPVEPQVAVSEDESPKTEAKVVSMTGEKVEN